MIYEYFLLMLDRKTGTAIAAPPLANGQAHIKMNMDAMMFITSYVRDVVDPEQFHVDAARNLARGFFADVYGRLEGGGEWKLLAGGMESTYPDAGGDAPESAQADAQ